MWSGLSLSKRLSLLTVVLLSIGGLVSLIVQIHNSERHANEVIQRISVNLAEHIVQSNQALLTPEGLNNAEVQHLFDRLMEVNPSVEVYLLNRDGKIITHAAPEGQVKLNRVRLEPIRAWMAKQPLPILGDDPRNPVSQKPFSLAPLQLNGMAWGYLYIVLAGQEYDQLSSELANRGLWRWSAIGIFTEVILVGLVALLAMRWITRPLRNLTQVVSGFRMDFPAPVIAPPPSESPGPIHRAGDEITRLEAAFVMMSERLSGQWKQLNELEQQRRDLIANISHDLRTPLTSLHGYLETLKFKADVLTESDKERYLDIALSQSRKVGSLAQSLFELARLEHGGVKPSKEVFSLADLVQDVAQKFELAIEARQQRLDITVERDLNPVIADLGLIERVLTNLMDNSIRHTPEGTQIVVKLCNSDHAVAVVLEDSGPGLPEQVDQNVFLATPEPKPGWRLVGGASSGLGLLIVRRILQLHGSELILDRSYKPGTRFRFELTHA